MRGKWRRVELCSWKFILNFNQTNLESQVKSVRFLLNKPIKWVNRCVKTEAKKLIKFMKSPLLSKMASYCNVTWSSTYCSNLNCIYLLQKRLVRLITKAHYLANTAPLFSQLKVLDIFSINSFSVTTFMYSYHHNLLPSTVAFVTCS